MLLKLGGSECVALAGPPDTWENVIPGVTYPCALYLLFLGAEV